MTIMDTMGNECTQAEMDLIYRIGERCRAIPSIGGVLTPPQIIQLAKWCQLMEFGPPDLVAARKAFPTLAYRKDAIVSAALNFLTKDLEVMETLGDPVHKHHWTLGTHPGSNVRERLVGDVFQDPVICECGATAWRFNWCGELRVTDVREPLR